MFQSTHPHGVRHEYKGHHVVEDEFQSTHPHGVRRGAHASPQPAARVSIHAPTRGATSWPPCSTCVTSCFNPRTHTGCDIACKGRRALSVTFQSTHPHGVRLDEVTNETTNNTFQSTHPHGVRRNYCAESFT